jgi:hypothetical protein
MVRPFVVAFLLSGFSAAALAQTNSTALSTTGKPAGDRGTHRTAAGAGLRGRMPGGSCQLGLISIVGNKFWIDDLGPFQFQHERRWARADWDLDNLVFARVRAAAPHLNVRKIEYDKEELRRGAQDRSFLDRLFYSFASDIRDFARKVAFTTPCDRYVVVHREMHPVDGRREWVVGIGVVRIRDLFVKERAYLYALTSIRTYGRNFELLDEAAASTGDDGGPMDFKHPAPFPGPKREIEIATFPAAPEQAAGNRAFRATIRSLLASSLDRTLPKVLRSQPREASQ